MKQNEEEYFYKGRIGIGYELSSLHNITKNKTYFVFTAIEKLVPSETMSLKQKEYFNKIKQRALNAKSAEEALNIIGYMYKRTPLIYKFSFEV